MSPLSVASNVSWRLKHPAVSWPLQRGECEPQVSSANVLITTTLAVCGCQYRVGVQLERTVSRDGRQRHLPVSTTKHIRDCNHTAEVSASCSFHANKLSWTDPDPSLCVCVYVCRCCYLAFIWHFKTDDKLTLLKPAETTRLQIYTHLKRTLQVDG